MDLNYLQIIIHNGYYESLFNIKNLNINVSRETNKMFIKKLESHLSNLYGAIV